MANNEILPFAGTDTGTNLLTQAEYNADSQRPIGNQPGVARSKLVNKVLRQTSLIASAIAQYFANRQSNDITDSLSAATLAGYMLNAIGGDTQKNSFNSAIAAGTADAITASYTPAVASLTNGLSLFVRATAANTSTTPTFTPNSGTVTAKAICKGAGSNLVAGDIAGAGHWLELQYDSTLDKWVLQNPAFGVSIAAPKQIQTVQATVAANALTLSLAAASLDFRSATVGSGVVNTRSVPATISLVVPSGATLGTVSGVSARLVLIAIDNAGTVELAVTNLAGGNVLDETGVINTTAISGASNSSNVYYSTAARTGVPYRVVGFVDISEATAGTWATAPSTIQGFGGRVLQTLPIQAAKAWVNFDGTLTGTITPRANFNISSVTKNTTGDYTLNFTNPMNDANYSVGFSVKTGSQYDFVPKINNAATPTTTSCRVINANSTGAAASAQDPSIFCVTIHGN